MSTELTEVTKAVAEFDRVGAGLAELRKQYGNVVYDVTTTAGMNDAKVARAAIREPRYEIERIRKAAKAPILALGKKLDTEAARITSELEKLERPIDGAIKAEEDRKEAEKQAVHAPAYGKERREPMEFARRFAEAGPELKQKMLADMRQPRDGMGQVRKFIEAVNKVQGKATSKFRPPQVGVPQ